MKLRSYLTGLPVINVSKGVDCRLGRLRGGEGGQKGDRRDDRCELHDGTHRFATLNTECRLERRQRGFIADGSHVRPMNFDQERVPG